MTRAAIAWIAVKSLLASLLATVVVGFLFAGIDQAIHWLPADCCTHDADWFVTAARFWVSYWWFIYLVIFYPLWLGLLVYFIRRLAPAGHRLAIAGMVCMIQGGLILIEITSAFLPGADWRDELVPVGIYFALGTALFLAGAYFAFLRPRPA